MFKWLNILISKTKEERDSNGEASYCAFLYDELEYYEAAIASITEKVKNGSANTHHLNNLGVLYWETGDNKKAVESFKKAMELDQENPVPFKNLGMFEEKNGDVELALKYFGEAVKADPSDYSLNLNNAYTLMKLNKPNEAISFFLKAIELGFNNDVVSRNLSKAYAEVGNDEKAREYNKLAKKLA